MIWQVGGLLVLAAFYGIYFGKMLFQRRKGIRTDQMARRKQRDKVFYIELLLKVTTYSIAVLEVNSIIRNEGIFSQSVRILGLLIASLGVVICGIAVYTMKDSWRAGVAEEEKTKMVTDGIYQFSRNPAFVGFDLVYLGIGITFYNPLLMFATIFVIFMLHMQILQEEQYLIKEFGKEYEIYCKQVKRYAGRYADEYEN